MKTKPKASYRIRNWNAYDAALKQRGSITFWVNEAVIEQWHNDQKTGKRGASYHYSDLAIATMGTLASVFHLAGRQTEGCLESLFLLMGIDLAVPDHSTLSRRLAKLSVELPVVPKAASVQIVVDSTGVKVYGEGEWKTRQHGISQRRTWRKLHLGVDEQTGEILAAMVTTNDVGDGQMLPELLDQIDGEMHQVSADGAYDQKQCYDAIREPTLRQRSRRVEGQKSGSMATAKPNATIETKICGGCEKWGAKPGSKKATIIVVRLLKQ